MKRNILLIFSVILIFVGISACTAQQDAVPEENHEAQVTFAVETVYAQIAMTSAAAEAMATPTPIPTNTLEPTLTPTTAPTETPTNVFAETPTTAPADAGANNAVAPQPAQPQSSGSQCLRANLEYETFPDGTELAPGQKFVKMWRIKNTGSCTWNQNYILRFYSGDLLGAGASITLTDVDIPTWGFVNLEVPMQAPEQAGTYKGYWKIVSDTGKIFGAGPDGKGWIWVEIKVVEQ